MLKKHFRHFWQTFFHPRVYLFIIIGTGIIFLTFFTVNNALEIGISGIASVFIGIGVNNLSSIETHLKDRQKENSKVRHTLKVMEITNTKIENIQTDLNAGNYQKATKGLTELKEFVNLIKQFLKEEPSLD